MLTLKFLITNGFEDGVSYTWSRGSQQVNESQNMTSVSDVYYYILYFIYY